MKTRTLTTITVAATVIAATAVPAGESKPVLKQIGRPAEFVDAIQYRPFSEEYIVTKRSAVFRVPAKNVEYARSVKPGDLDSAVRARNAAVLERIRKKHRGLGWDTVALRHLVPIYISKKQPGLAINAFEDLRDRTTAIPTDLYRQYLDALKAAGKNATLQEELENLMSTGPRDLAAMANIMRGDMLMKEGQVRLALVDGYLRTAVLFRNVKDQRRETLEKTIAALEQLHDRRAEKFRQQLKREFPDSTT